MTGKILIIEDESRLRTMLQRVLQCEGRVVVTAVDGEEGIRCLEQAAFDLVITDIMLGAVSGFDVMHYINTHTPETLVIVLTGYASTESAIAALRHRAYDYIAKPFEVEMLEASVNRALEKIRLQREVKRDSRKQEEQAQELVRSRELVSRL